MENEYPSLSQQGKNLATFALHVARKAFYEGTASIAVSEGIQRARLSTCRECPSYDDIQHRCKECGYEFEIRQRFSDDPLTDCPECAESALRKVVNSVGIVFKGSGFYVTDSKNGKTAAVSTPSETNGSSSSNGSSEKSAPSNSESKPEVAKDKKSETAQSS